MTITIDDLETIRQAARTFIGQMGNNRIFAFYGKMGAGKTTFVKALCEELGVTDVVTSPTFAIVNEYSIDKGSECSHQCSVDKVFHFDFYRVKRIEEVYDLGYEDYFYHPRALCFIEWPELVEELLPDNAVRVNITENADGTRTIETE